MKSRITAYSQEEFEKHANTIHQKYEDGKKLQPIEIEFLCTGIRHEHQHLYPICDEFRFKNYYFKYKYPDKVPLGYEITDNELAELHFMADDWYNNVVLVTNHKSQTLQYIGKETREEIKQMAKEFKYNGYLVKSRLYEAKLQKILWMSRFIHFKIVYEYFLGYKSYEISTSSKFGEVVFNDYTLSHIYTRHFAAGEKQYLPNQSFFSPDIHFNSIHRIIFLVLGWITKKNINIAQPANKAISFKYKGDYYQLYMDNAFIQRKGHKGNLSVLRVESLFPVNDGRILQRISALAPHQVSKNLVIYEQ